MLNPEEKKDLRSIKFKFEEETERGNSAGYWRNTAEVEAQRPREAVSVLTVRSSRQYRP
jgi:hypothetical protein